MKHFYMEEMVNLISEAFGDEDPRPNIKNMEEVKKAVNHLNHFAETCEDEDKAEAVRRWARNFEDHWKARF